MHAPKLCPPWLFFHQWECITSCAINKQSQFLVVRLEVHCMTDCTKNLWQNRISFPNNLSKKMPAKQRIRVANEKHSQNVTQRGNVSKSLVSLLGFVLPLLWMPADGDWMMRYSRIFLWILATKRWKICCWTSIIRIIYICCVWFRWVLIRFGALHPTI